MKCSHSKIIQISSTTLVVIALLGYIGYQARNIVSGPQLEITSPLNGSSFTDPLITVVGAAHNISAISLNDRPIFIDQHGNFSEKLLLAPGYTIMKVQAQDKFGRETQQLLELTYTPAITPYNTHSSRNESASSTEPDAVVTLLSN
jgi:hypothetical protein